ncbi:MAG TPA: putative sulfate exporter family transporter [Bryobacteraceae bacterium]|nr:putative sulfate exporter family transporter [Bryobacteraceae bacterium]
MSLKGRITEDWLAVFTGLFIFVLSLAVFLGADLLGWAVTTRVWTNISTALAPASSAYAALNPFVSLVATWLFLLLVLAPGARALRADMPRFVTGFTAVFFLSYACWVAGSWANIAATPDKMAQYGVRWSLNLTAEAGFIIALLAGLVIGNFLPGVAAFMKEAIRPELYIKTAIVILGGFLGVTAAEQLGLATSVMFRGLCAIVEAYLIYWALVYYIARRYFKFSREWAVPLASGISICGVSAAIATGSAIRARPVVPVMVSSLVVIFAVVELLLLPFLAQHFLASEPMVAGAWMGLAVKTDGAAVASGAITDALIRAKAAGSGVYYQPGWIMAATTTVKVFIDVFIAVWAFILAWIWSAKIDRREGEKVRAIQIWERLPKFILGYLVTFAAILTLGVLYPSLVGRAKAAMAQANNFRSIFFVMTFFTIGVVSNFRKLWEEGIGRLALVYVLCLFGFIIWIGLAISWLFFHGVKPPLVAG